MSLFKSLFFIPPRWIIPKNAINVQKTASLALLQLCTKTQHLLYFPADIDGGPKQGGHEAISEGRTNSWWRVLSLTWVELSVRYHNCVF